MIVLPTNACSPKTKSRVNCAVLYLKSFRATCEASIKLCHYHHYCHINGISLFLCVCVWLSSIFHSYDTMLMVISGHVPRLVTHIEIYIDILSSNRIINTDLRTHRPAFADCNKKEAELLIFEKQWKWKWMSSLRLFSFFFSALCTALFLLENLYLPNELIITFSVFYSNQSKVVVQWILSVGDSQYWMIFLPFVLQQNQWWWKE